MSLRGDVNWFSSILPKFEQILKYSNIRSSLIKHFKGISFDFQLEKRDMQCRGTRKKRSSRWNKLRSRIANKSLCCPGDTGRREKKREEKKIISTGSLLADPISGSTADGRRCLRLDRIAFLAVAY